MCQKHNIQDIHTLNGFFNHFSSSARVDAKSKSQSLLLSSRTNLGNPDGEFYSRGFAALSEHVHEAHDA